MLRLAVVYPTCRRETTGKALVWHLSSYSLLVVDQTEPRVLRPLLNLQPDC